MPVIIVPSTDTFSMRSLIDTVWRQTVDWYLWSYGEGHGGVFIGSKDMFADNVHPRPRRPIISNIRHIAHPHNNLHKQVNTLFHISSGRGGDDFIFYARARGAAPAGGNEGIVVLPLEGKDGEVDGGLFHEGSLGGGH